MKFIVSRNKLLEALQHARVVLSHSCKEMLGNNMIVFIQNESNPKEMTVMATDCYVWVEEVTELDEPVVDPRAFAVDSHVIIKAIKSLEEQPLEFVIGEYQLTVKHSFGSFMLPIAENAEEILSINKPILNFDADDAISFGQEAPGMKSIFSRLKCAMADDDLRPAMSGICMNLTKEYADYVASDGHRLMRIRKDSVVKDGKTVEAQFIIPRNIVNMLLKLLPQTGNLVVSYIPKKEQKTDDGRVLTTRNAAVGIEIDGKICVEFYPTDSLYPKYQNVIPSACNLQITIERKKLMATINRLSLFDMARQKLVFRIKNGEMSVSSSDYDINMSAEEQLSCTMTDLNNQHLSDSLVFGVKHSFIASVLHTMKSENVVLNFTEQGHAIVIQPVPQPDVEDVIALVMPIMVD